MLSHLKQRIRNSLRLKLALFLSVVTAVLTIIFSSYLITSERHAYRTRLEDKGTLLATILAESLRMPLYSGFNDEIARHTANIFAFGDVASIKVFDSRHELITSSSATKAPSVVAAMTITRQITTHSGQQTPEALLLGETLPDRLIGSIELTMDQSQLAGMQKNLLVAATLLALLFWITTSALTFFILRRVTTTFHQLMAGVRNIEAGDLVSRIPTSDTDEPGRALAAINSLAEALQLKNEENERLQAEIVKGLRTQLDDEKARNMAKLIQTNRMTSLGLLVSSMAHEINNPNCAIRLAAEIVERGWKDVLPLLDEFAKTEGEYKLCGMPYTDAIESIDEAVTAIMRSSYRIEKVVDNLRSYSLGNRDNEFMSFSMNRVTENSVAIIRAHGRMENKVINMALAPDLPDVWGNPFQLEQVVTNLLMNSIQAMAINDGKIVTISTDVDEKSGEPLLAIIDSGPGISAENMPHIFEPFFSTRIGQGGSGLGLYIANFIIREQNGSLSIVNLESGGCRALIRLPTAKAVKHLQSETTPASC